MAQYRTCEHCGAALDPGERCDCRGAERTRKEKPACERQLRLAGNSVNNSMYSIGRKGAACQ